jgi:hypothetical protein
VYFIEQLRTLGLAFTSIGDAGLRELTGLKQLQRLDLRGTHVTTGGVQALQ